ncbi:MAG: histidine kinase [Flavitalea sp.]
MTKNKMLALGTDGNLLYANLRAVVLGAIIGCALSLIFTVFSRSGFTHMQFIYNVVFSIFITLSITNVVAIFQRLPITSNKGFWFFITGYYLSNFAGMVIGTELSYMVVETIKYGAPAYRLHPGEYRSSATIVFIVGTILLLYNMQLARSSAEITAKNNDLARLRQLQSETELQALQSRINPHFLYNSLNSIASLIHEDPDKAEQMTIMLSKLFRYTINSAKENMHSLKDELDILRTYISIEQVRFGERMKFSIDADPGLEQVNVPRFLVQPLVENSIKHGLSNKSKEAEIRIVVKKEEQNIQVLVYDNGSPFPGDLRMGYGMQSTFDKLKLLYIDNYDVQLINDPKHIKITFPVTV